MSHCLYFWSHHCTCYLNCSLFESISSTEDCSIIERLNKICSSRREVSTNIKLANKIAALVKSKLKDGNITLSLDNPCANLRMNNSEMVILNLWIRPGNEYVVYDQDDMRSVDISRDQILHDGFRITGGKRSICISIVFDGIMAMADSNDAESPLPLLLLNLVPLHTKTVDYPKSDKDMENSGSTKLDASNIDIAKLILTHVLKACQAIWVEGNDGSDAIFRLIKKLGLITEIISDDMIGALSRITMNSVQGIKAHHWLFLLQTDQRITPASFSPAFSWDRQLVNQRIGGLVSPFHLFTIE